MSMGWNGKWIWVAGTAALALALTGCAKKEPAPPKAVWNSSLDTALADARAHHRPIILDFFADW